MGGVFLTILNMGITAGYLVLAVLLLRLLFRKAPKWTRCVLWGFVALRLLIPFTPESRLSLMPGSYPVSQESLRAELALTELRPQELIPIEPGFVPSTPVPGGTMIEAGSVLSLGELGAWIWLGGTVLMLSYLLFSYLRVRRTVREAVCQTGNVWVCDHIKSPFILGIWKPRIYLPSRLSAEESAFVLAHEQAHLRRRDHWWKPLGYVLLCIYWFNPLLWLAYILLCRDIELACDENVMEGLGEDGKKPYSLALINCSVSGRFPAACPLAFGEGSVKGRVKSILAYKKPAFWVIVLSVLVLSLAAACLLTSPLGVDRELEAFLGEQIMAHHQGKYLGSYAVYLSDDLQVSKNPVIGIGNLCMVYDCDVLKVSKSRGITSVYAWVLYQEYVYENGQVKHKSGARTPTVITARKEAGGGYSLVEYWTSGNGTRYVPSIQDKFPWYLWGRVLGDPSRRSQRQQTRCREQAEQYFAEGGLTIEPEATEHPIPQETQGVEVSRWDIYVMEEPHGGSYICSMVPAGQEVSYDAFISGSCMTVEEAGELCQDLKPEDVTVIPLLHPAAGPVPDYFTEKGDPHYIPHLRELLGVSLTRLYPELASAVFDADGDGKEEECVLYMGGTSGIYTFCLTAGFNGREGYFSIFHSPWYELGFIQEDGVWKVQGIGLNEGENHIYDMVFEDGQLRLLREGEYLPQLP